MSTENTERTVSFDATVYRLSAIKRAAYKLGDRCFVQISTTMPGSIVVHLRSKFDGVPLNLIADELQNEVLDQELREVIAEETASVRNLLLAQAFSATSLVDPIGESGDFREDPLELHRPDLESQASLSTDIAGTLRNDDGS